MMFIVGQFDEVVFQIKFFGSCVQRNDLDCKNSKIFGNQKRPSEGVKQQKFP